MVKIIGRLRDVGIAKEAVRGAGAAPAFWIPKTSFTIGDKALKARTRESYSHIGADGNQAIVTREWSEGDLEFDMYDKSFGLILFALLGAKSVSGPTDSAYTHTFTLDNTNQHQSLAVVVKEGSINDLMYRLAMINSMSMTITPDDTVKISVNFMGKKSAGSSATSSYISENVFVGRHLSFKLATLASGLGAATAIPLKSLTINFEKNAILDHNLGSSTPTDILNQMFRITGEVELDYQDRTYAALMSNGSYRALRMTLTHNTLIGVSSVPTFNLDLSRVDFDTWEQDDTQDDIVRQKFNFTAMYDVTNANIINSCTLINGQTSY